MSNYQFDYIIIGCGLAGLYSAFNASKVGSVALITKTSLEISNSYWAQGGIAAALNAGDSPESHYNDTLKAGRNLCDKTAVEILVNEGRDKIKELIEMGMPFDKTNDKISFGLEGGHSFRRVLHAGGDATGKEIVNFILKYILNNKRIKIFENCFVHKLLVKENECFGASLFDFTNKENINLSGKYTFVASGGGSAIYSRSTNPDAAIGDGIALAYDGGARIESMEFIQFHPTSFYSNSGETFLISEAVRGEGAYLVNSNNKRFLFEHNITELAPRDEVSEAIFNEMNKSGSPNVFLKLDHLDQVKIKKRFSNIYTEALKFGIDITKDPVPVAPAAHYMIGGIKTGLNAETNINRLFAVGEAASSGIHGANRLASNSLLECIVFAKRAVDYSTTYKEKTLPVDGSNISYDPEKENDFIKFKNETAKLLWDYAGILRSKDKMETALRELEILNSAYPFSSNEYYSVKTKNMVLISKMILESALIRKESRGCHSRSDFPEENDIFAGTFIHRKNEQIKFDKH